MDTEAILQRLSEVRVIPVIAIEKADDILPLCKALEAGGLNVAEITFRTAAAPDAIRLVADKFPEFLLGAGTVTRLEEVDRAVEAGARFAVAPGYNPNIVLRAKEKDLPFFPGVCTPSDIEAALENDCTTLKFFPAGAMGGLDMLGSLYGPYKHRGVRFVPTGGVSTKNLHEYLAHPGVIAVGGTWIAKADLIKEGKWDEITKLASEAVQIAQTR